jgi:mannose-6-phosphate isomerase class I
MSLLSVEIYENSISTYLNYDFPKQNDIPTGVASQLLQDVKRFLCGVEKSPEKKSQDFCTEPRWGSRSAKEFLG